MALRAFWVVQAWRMHFFVADSVWYLEPGQDFSRCNRWSCIGSRPSGGPAPWCLGRLFIFARCNFRFRIQWKSHCQQRTLSSEQANFVSNISKGAQFLCSCCTVYLPSTTILTRLTEDDDVIKSLHKGAPCLGLALTRSYYGRPCWVHIQKMKDQRVAASFRDIDRMGSVFMTLL